MKPTILTLAALLSLTTATAFGDSNAATMNVSVQVIARANVTVASQPADVNVTESDLARGYVDVAAPIVVRALTNSRRGYLLQVSNSNAAFSSMELAFGDTAMTVAGEGWINRPYVPGGEIVSMKARLRLAPGSSTGRYALPVVVSAIPL